MPRGRGRRRRGRCRAGRAADRYLRELKSTRWKGIQRLNYTLFALVVVHALFYGALRRMDSPFTRILIVTTVAVLLGQGIGIWLWKRQHGRPGLEAAC